MTSSTKPAAGAVLASALVLSACSGGGGETTSETVTQTVTHESHSATHTTSPATSASSSTASSPTTQGTTASPSRAVPPSGGDPVFAAIDAALGAHQGAIVVDIDRDDGDSFDIDVVVGNEQIELEVSAGGAVREDEREADDDDVREAHAATVTAADAIRQALDRHPGGVLDELELDEDDGALRWEIDLDDDRRGDLAEVEIPAT